MVQRVTENSVQPQGYTGARVQAADFASAGRAIARGAANLGAGVTDAAESLDKINEIYDTAAVKKADTEDLAQIMELRAQALNAEGFDAQTAVQSARQEMAEIKKRRLSSFTNPRQRRMYSDVFDARNLQIEEQFIGHATKQVVAANKGVAVAAAETYSDAAVSSWGTPSFEPMLDTALQNIAAANPGAGTVAITRLQSKQRSSVFSRIIESMLNDPEKVLDAKDTLDAHALDLLPDDETRLRKVLNPLVEEQAGEADVGYIIATAGRDDDGADAPGAPPRDELAPLPEGSSESKGDPYYEYKPTAPTRAFKPLDVTGGAGRVTESAKGHRERGSGNALDIAAPAGTPIHPPMSGTVRGEPFWTDRGGWQVMIEHPNGYVTGYAHMRSKPALTAGQQVERNTVIGSVGSTGHSTGPHVHFTVRTSAGGPKVDPEVVEWKQTADPKKVDWKEPALNLATPQKDATASYIARLNKVAAAQKWSQPRYDRALSGIVAHGARNEALFNKQQNARYSAALERVVELGEGLTSRAQIPGFGELDPQNKITIDNIIKSNLSGPSEEDKAGGGTYLGLLTTMYQDRAAFAGMSQKELLSHSGSMSRGEFKSLYTNWLALNNDPKGAFAASLDDAGSAARRYLPTDIDPTRKQLFMDRYMEEVTRRQGNQKIPLTPQERDQIARSMTVEAVRYRGSDATKGFLFEYQPGRGDTRATVNYEEVYSRIPVPLHNQIVEQLRREGKPHSKQDVVRVYLRLGR